MKETTQFAKAIRKARIDLNETLKDMARHIGLSTSYISAIETGRKKICLGTIDKIESYFTSKRVKVENLYELAMVSNKCILLPDEISLTQALLTIELARTKYTQYQLSKIDSFLKKLEKERK